MFIVNFDVSNHNILPILQFNVPDYTAGVSMKYL